MNETAITGIARSPIGALNGALSGLSAPQIAAPTIKAALGRAGVSAAQVDEALMGCVLSAGVGMAPARQAAALAGLGEDVPCLTLNKVCGSGMKAIMLGADAIQAGRARVVVAGGMESMSSAPLLAPRPPKNAPEAEFDPTQIRDHLFVDGLEAPLTRELMGAQAQALADRYGLTRAELDEVARASLRRAKQALADGWFADEIVPLDAGANGAVATDELPLKFSEDKIGRLKPAFAPAGSLTAASASALADGAAALVLQSSADVKNSAPAPRIVAQAATATAPIEFTHAPVEAIQRVLESAGWTAADVDLYEINEAFASAPLYAMRELNIDPQRVNAHGGACALGHPLGCSGARIVVTLINALKQRGERRAVAAICIGGGEATALAIEMR